MEEPRKELRFSEVLVSGIFVLASAVVWAGAVELSTGNLSPWLLLGGLFTAALAFSVLVVIEGTHPLLLLAALFLGFGIAVPIAFVYALPVGIPAALLAVLLAELGVMWSNRIKRIFRKLPVILTARRGLTLYFSAVSLILTAIVFISPLGPHKSIVEVFPETLVRRLIIWVDPLLQPSLGVSISGTVDELIADIAGIDDPRALTVLRQQYASQYEIPLTGEEDLALVASMLIARQTVGFQNVFSYLYRIGFFVSAFFLFRFLAVLFSWLTVLPLFPALRLLRLTGSVAEFEEPVVRTVLRWR